MSIILLSEIVRLREVVVVVSSSVFVLVVVVEKEGCVMKFTQ